MKGERPLFSNEELVSERTREQWRSRICIILDAVEGGAELTEWEETFIQDIDKKLSDGRDLTLSQSSKLNQIFHKVEEAIG